MRQSSYPLPSLSRILRHSSSRGSSPSMLFFRASRLHARFRARCLRWEREPAPHCHSLPRYATLAGQGHVSDGNKPYAPYISIAIDIAAYAH
jgi:hypothetical protein